MNKIFEQSKDLHVANYVVYGKAADKKLYIDAAFTTQADEADVADAFTKGRLLVAVGDVSYVPVAMEDEKVTIITVTGSGTLTATPVVYSAKAA